MIAQGVGADIVAFLKKLIPDVRDVLVFGGIAGAAYGISMIHLPAAYIFAGLTVFWLGVRK